ncbi:MAG TPA: DUF2292 domain-containing protein [Hungateiclostridium thermocellum]|uniref:DUF2292 domain-containing protein n=2 Tax=Acetivibrio thermocellus TaxID=1515 RepID=A3DJ53_ACET2|nr:YezD family protein [Acetivibrio thermocellus]CDG37302.1 hypothetical protein CTHBC1_2719 [Acetivibrio thermocellus BC1]ABN53982.1 Protein of unknown function DUF2292 [Acetivibrio thermocellus ATCC 27405]ADU73461.1 Protein of unknown function DUF2292 [Acetivibrio thermocellus DSM 1313]ALX07383.1 Protein of unknown function DUF2292 [Acetivibrio thermocellus AD2]ANV75121.1 Protein of unknown function DUF2292 [Acetivibrio thermocellus DSM 2360]
MPEVNRSQKRAISEEDAKMLIKIINDIKFGTVTIIIQDGRVVQIEKNEKIRLV